MKFKYLGFALGGAGFAKHHELKLEGVMGDPDYQDSTHSLCRDSDYPDGYECLMYKDGSWMTVDDPKVREAMILAAWPMVESVGVVNE